MYIMKYFVLQVFPIVILVYTYIYYIHIVHQYMNKNKTKYEQLKLPNTISIHGQQYTTNLVRCELNKGICKVKQIQKIQK